jgi:hypothetical protein
MLGVRFLVNMIYLDIIIAMKYSLYITLIVMLGCKNSNSNISQKKENNNSKIINYLKRNFHIEVDTSKMGIYYKKDLLERGISLDVDSLIGSRIVINQYKPLNLNFISYDNYFGIDDTSRENHFSVNLIEDLNTGLFYTDFINDKAGMITEDYCAWSSRQNKISRSDFKSDVSDEDIKAYNSINSNRLYGQNETYFTNKKKGIEQYLNSAFRLSRPTKLQLDSLFYNYDKILYYRRDTLLSSSNDLFGFLRIQAAKMRARPDYGDLNKRLELLKSQINLLLLQTGEHSSENLLFWIYKNDWRLRVRKLKISGNKRSTYFYNINETDICF